jgi:hypothetical protein
MMYNAGDFDTTETVHIPINSFSSDDPTASVTMTNLAAGDIEIHKDGSATQRASDNGVTVDIDFDSITGNHMIHIDLSDNTDAGFYSAGSRYLVRIEGVTVDGGTLNAWVGGFSIGCTLRPTTAGRTLDVETGGCAGIDWANVANPTTTVDLSATDIQLVDTCTTNSDMRGTDSAATAAALATHDGKLDTVDGIVDDIVADTNELQTDDTPGALAAIDAKIDIIDTTVDTILVDTGTTLPAEHAALPTAAENRAEMDSNSTQLAAIVADTNELQTDITNGGRVDLILDELTSQGDTNEGKLDTIDTVVDAVLADTDALQTALLSAFSEVTAKPAAGAALAGKIAFLFHAAVQKATFNGTSGVHTLYQSNGSSALGTRTLTDDGTTQTTGAIS